MTFPDVTHMLPNQARKAITDYFVACLKAKPLNYQGNPTYRLENAYDDARKSSAYAWELVADSFDVALKEFNAQHPLCWDNEKQQAFPERL